MDKLIKVTTTTYQGSKTQQWKEAFNQAMFINYDPANPLTIGKFVIPPGQTIGGVLYPTYLSIPLNAGEVNDSMFIIDTGNSTTANYWIVYTEYLYKE